MTFTLHFRFAGNSENFEDNKYLILNIAKTLDFIEIAIGANDLNPIEVKNEYFEGETKAVENKNEYFEEETKAVDDKNE